jgi:transcriptional antiterminator NusG
MAMPATKEDAGESQFKWYVVRAITGQEQKVKRYIEAELKKENLQDNLRDILIPSENVVQLQRGKKITKERNYFPGYILVEARLVGEVQQVIKSVPGVVGFLGSGDKPQPMRASEVDRIKGKVDEINEQGGSVEIPFSVNESVKVIDGPFNGFDGVIEEVNEEKKKLKVIVKIFGRRTPVELNYLQVEKQ